MLCSSDWSSGVVTVSSAPSETRFILYTKKEESYDGRRDDLLPDSSENIVLMPHVAVFGFSFRPKDNKGSKTDLRASLR